MSFSDLCVLFLFTFLRCTVCQCFGGNSRFCCRKEQEVRVRRAQDCKRQSSSWFLSSSAFLSSLAADARTGLKGFTQSCDGYMAKTSGGEHQEQHFDGVYLRKREFHKLLRPGCSLSFQPSLPPTSIPSILQRKSCFWFLASPSARVFSPCPDSHHFFLTNSYLPFKNQLRSLFLEEVLL